ncbi:MAG: Tad domain-containing protein [Anaerolineae bacterium]|nr:Tad domain-containing protein [Anaerolineae bacterium]
MSAHRRSNHKNRSIFFRRHPGQAIVLIALAMVALLGMVALAIDGGQLYFLQRDAQNAADAAIVAALFELCKDPNISDVDRASSAVAAGESAAIQNGFDNADDDVDVTVTVPYNGSYNDVEVVITADKPAQLVQVVYQGPLVVTARTTGHCEAGHPFSSTGFAAFAGSTCCSPKDAVKINGSGNTCEIVGGTHSNGCTMLSGPDTHIDSVSLTSDLHSSVPEENITLVDDDADSVPIPEIWKIEDFRPGGKYAAIANDDLNPTQDHYFDYSGSDIESLPQNPDGTVVQGIYYTDGDIWLKKEDFGNGAAGVTFACEGSFRVNTKINVPFTVYDPPDIEPLPLVFSNYGDGSCGQENDSAIKLTSGVYWLGVLYAPNGHVSLSFSAGGADVYGCIVANTLDITVSEVTLICDPRLFPPVKPVVGISD